MTKDDIITLPDSRLRQRSQRVAHVDDSIRQLVADMATATLDWGASRPHEVEVALAAVQVGQLHRVVIVREDFEDKHNDRFQAFINPEIVKYEGEPEEDLEGCLSVTDVYAQVARYPKVKVKALNLAGQSVRLTATGFLARVFQHEIDHTNGIVIVDRAQDTSKLFALQPDGSFTPAHTPAEAS